MTIQPIGPSSTLLFLSSADLQARGLHPEQLNRGTLLKLARGELSSLSQITDDSVELESYSDKNGLLLFVRFPPPDQTVWRFMSSDALLDALLPGLNLLSGPVYCWKDCFWLIAGADFDPRLSEFADPVEYDPILCARLAEYAQPMFP